MPKVCDSRMWISQPATSSSLPLMQELTPKSTRNTAKALRKWNYVRENIAKAQAKANSDYKATTHSFEQYVLYWDLLSWGDFCCDFFILFSAIGFVNHLESEDMFLKTCFWKFVSRFSSIKESNHVKSKIILGGGKNLPQKTTYPNITFSKRGEPWRNFNLRFGEPQNFHRFCGLAAEIRLVADCQIQVFQGFWGVKLCPNISFSGCQERNIHVHFVGRWRHNTLL